MTLLTVYITNYNYGRYIRQAIESVLNQTFQDFELFIIDDGSTDDSKSIIEAYASNSKVTVVYQKNKGLNITNNIALRLSQGKYIMRLDADDYLSEDALESMVNLLEADSNLGMVFPDYYLVDANNTVTAEVKRHDFKSDVQLYDQPAHGACTVIRTSFLKSVGGYDESYSCQDGYELWIKFIAKYKVSNIAKELFYYRQHGSNLTSNEKRILDTRRDINVNFIKNNKIQTPVTIAIIPVRGTTLSGDLLAFIKLGGKNIIDIKIEALLQSESLEKIVVTSSIKEVKLHVEAQYKNNDRIIFIDRPADLARFNVSLSGTIDHILAHDRLQKIDIEALMVIPLEYIFLTGGIVDDAINVLEIFKADSVISVRPEYASYFQHHGNGMVPIMSQTNYTQLEREAIYKSTGGLQLTRLSSYQKNKNVQSGKVGHIVVEKKVSIGIYSLFDLKLARLLVEQENIVVNREI
jgi:glycosyltransferase involved in cell wall biosynthesis